MNKKISIQLRYKNKILYAERLDFKSYLEVNSYNVDNCAKFLAWQHKTTHFGKINTLVLNDADYNYDNREIFTENMGTHNFGFVENGVIWFCWAIEYAETIFLLFSSKKGTKYEVIYPDAQMKFGVDKKIADIIIGFHYWLLTNIFSISPCAM